MNSLVNPGYVVDNFLRSVVPELHARPGSRFGDAAPVRRVHIDVLDLGNAYRIDAELPGLSRDAIKVSIEGKVVSLSAEYKPADGREARPAAAQAQPRQQPAEAADGESQTEVAIAVADEVAQPKVLHAERAWGKVSRVLQLPVEVDASLAKARYENGLLTLRLPKQARSSVQQLAIE